MNEFYENLFCFNKCRLIIQVSCSSSVLNLLKDLKLVKTKMWRIILWMRKDAKALKEIISEMNKRFNKWMQEENHEV